jgi:protein-ribulosamine 3-kinase
MNGFFDSILLSAFGRQDFEMKVQTVSAGCINNAAKLCTKKGSYFLKWNEGSTDIFAKELLGLDLLNGCSEINIPKTYQSGEIDGKAYLLMEYIETGENTSKYWENLGIGLAGLHQTTNSYFGLDHNNFIGSLSQSNTYEHTWIDFFINQRLIPQMQIALSMGLINGSISRQFESLFSRLEKLVPKEKPALLHGDLWRENILCGYESKPFIMDPAVYYGHREAELSFTKLLGDLTLPFIPLIIIHFP